MGHSARFYFILLHLANLHFSFQCINVNSSKFNNISVINVSVKESINMSVIIMCISMCQTKNMTILILS